MSFRKSVLLYCAALALGFSFSSVTYAASSDIDPACDTKFMQTLKDRAWMEVQRETMIAQSVIAKPDSVFALGCFGSLLGLLSGHVHFGENHTKDFSDYLTNNGYLKASFDHSLGGGHLSSGSSSNIGDCAAMANMWQEAKCASAEVGNIMSLKDFSGTETRGFAMKACNPSNTQDPAKTQWQKSIDTMKTYGAIYYQKGDPKPATGDFDVMNIFWGVTAPLSMTPTPTQTQPKCSGPIKTGVLLSGDDPEVVCPNPGCSPTGGKNPKCCQTGSTSGSTCTP